MRDLRRTLSGVPSCTSESSHAGWVRVAVLSSANELGQTLIGICAPRDTCVSTTGAQAVQPNQNAPHASRLIWELQDASQRERLTPWTLARAAL